MVTWNILCGYMEQGLEAAPYSEYFIPSPWCVCVCVCVCVCSRAHLYPTLCDPMDCSLPGSSIHGIFQARMLEWLLFPPPEYLPDPGIEPSSCVFCIAGRLLYTEPPESGQSQGLRFKLGLNLMAQVVKNLTAIVGDLGSVPGLGRSPGEGNGSPLQ